MKGIRAIVALYPLCDNRQDSLASGNPGRYPRRIRREVTRIESSRHRTFTASPDGLNPERLIMVRQIPFACALLLLGTMLPTTVAQAQNQQIEPEKKNINLRAVIQDIRPGFFQVETEGGDTWICKIEAEPSDVTITGTADISWLRPGMYIRFSAGLKE